jgi:hypothetical protein
MNRFALQALLCLIVSTPLAAQQSTQAVSPSNPAQPVATGQQTADLPQPSPSSERTQAIKKARTVYISSKTNFLTISTLERALLKQKGWEKLGLNIVTNENAADLEIAVDRLIFTHIHTYVVTDKGTSIVLAAGRVRAFDGVVASGPMAEQIVKALATTRLPAHPASGDQGY